MRKPVEILEHFSLTSQQAELYLLLLKQGPSKVSDLAHLQKKNRAAVTFHLAQLLDRGLVKESRAGRRTEYVALPPKELADLFERWTVDFKSIVPELESMRGADVHKPLVEVIESTAGIKRIYDEMSALPSGSSFLVLEGKTALRGELKLLSNKEWSVFFQRMVDRRILTRAVFTRESMAIPSKGLSEENKRLLRSRLWDLRSLPESALPLEHLMMIYGNKAAFLIPETKLLFTLEHGGIVGILRSLFESIHSFAKTIDGGWEK